MLNKQKHQLLMGRILRDMYTDIHVSPLLGLKGGTCAYFFYDLPRFSVDLDFDMLLPEQNNRQLIFDTIVAILQKYGRIKDQTMKRNTIFVLLSYGEEDHNIKVEISAPILPFPVRSHYEFKEHLGIPMFAATKDYLFAGKLAALALRQTTAMRDVYDVHFFAKNNWNFSADVLTAYTGKDAKASLSACIEIIQNIPDNQLLQGLGELVQPEEKEWIKGHLKNDVIFMLKNYLSVL